MKPWVAGRGVAGRPALVIMSLVAVTLASCSNPWQLSVPATAQGALPEVTNDRASIVLMWPSETGGGYSVNVVAADTHQVQAQFDAGEWTVIEVPAGEVELYFAPGHRESSRVPRPVPELLTGEVAAGRVYLVRYSAADLEVEVLEAGSSHWAQVATWLTSLRRVDCNRPLAARYSNERGAVLHAAHAEARERFLRLGTAARGLRTLHAVRQPFPRSPATVTVHLRDGSSIRGVVIEYLPRQSITVHGQGGAPTQLPMRLVERVEFE
jgi:hypothetical protein